MKDEGILTSQGPGKKPQYLIDDLSIVDLKLDDDTEALLSLREYANTELGKSMGLNEALVDQMKPWQSINNFSNQEMRRKYVASHDPFETQDSYSYAVNMTPEEFYERFCTKAKSKPNLLLLIKP